MKKLRIMAVDDEALALTRIEALLRRIAGAELVAVARTAGDAIARISQGGIDVVLLDIRLTGSDGFDVAAALRDPRSPQVIFVTSYDEYAVRAFDVAATDFLMKPVETARLRQALERARATERAHASRANESPNPDLAAIWLSLREGGVRVRLVDILWIEADGDYIRVHTDHGAHFLRRTLSGFEAELDPSRFLRVSRSAVVQVGRLKELRRAKRGGWVTLDNGQQVKVGRNYQAEVWRRLA